MRGKEQSITTLKDLKEKLGAIHILYTNITRLEEEIDLIGLLEELSVELESEVMSILLEDTRKGRKYIDLELEGYSIDSIFREITEGVSIYKDVVFYLKEGEIYAVFDYLSKKPKYRWFRVKKEDRLVTDILFYGGITLEEVEKVTESLYPHILRAFNWKKGMTW